MSDDLTTHPLHKPKVTVYHSPNCSLGKTDTPDGDFCNCEGVVRLGEYKKLKAANEIAYAQRNELSLIVKAYEGGALHDELVKARKQLVKAYEALGKLRAVCERVHLRLTTGGFFHDEDIIEMGKLLGEKHGL